ncbi:hypothetical protein GmHk_06G015352 [Glycine max]|nr:hypothetical protein GmHk_06G015352 [Glycine max]
MANPSWLLSKLTYYNKGKRTEALRSTEHILEIGLYRKWFDPLHGYQIGDTKTGVFPVTGWRLAACSSCFHASFRFSAAVFSIASSSLN